MHRYKSVFVTTLTFFRHAPNSFLLLILPALVSIAISQALYSIICAIKYRILLMKSSVNSAEINSAFLFAVLNLFISLMISSNAMESHPPQAGGISTYRNFVF